MAFFQPKSLTIKGPVYVEGKEEWRILILFVCLVREHTLNLFLKCLAT